MTLNMPSCKLLSPTAPWQPRADIPLGTHPGGAAGLQCFHKVLHFLSTANGCMSRVSFANNSHLGFQFSIYGLVVPKLAIRFEMIKSRLQALAATNVTFVTCANKEDVEALQPQDRTCLHPEYAKTRFSLSENQTALPTGTLSLALKHYLAYYDMWQQGLPAALVLEDDATIDPTLAPLLSKYWLPCDADIFYLSSYYRSKTVHSSGANKDPVVKTRGKSAIHRRRNGSLPVAGSGYVVFAGGVLTMLSQPIRLEADNALSLQQPTPFCGSTSPWCPFVVPRDQYAPTSWLFGQDRRYGEKSHDPEPDREEPPCNAISAGASNSTMHCQLQPRLICNCSHEWTAATEMSTAAEHGTASCASDAQLLTVGQRCLSGCCDYGSSMYMWFRSVCEVWYRSSVDGMMLPAMFHRPPANPKIWSSGVPLLVGLHAWTATHKDNGFNILGAWSKRRRWALIVPHMRGPKVGATAIGSATAVQDVFDAIKFAGTHSKVDPRRIYIIGGSGGGAHLALMLAAVAPRMWAGVSLWAPIFDLIKWHHFCRKSRCRQPASVMEMASKPANARTRSPSYHLRHGQGGPPLDINAGIFDGSGPSGGVPISHALEAFNAVASEADRIPARQVAEFSTVQRVPDALNESIRPSCREPWLLLGNRIERPSKVLFCRRSGPARVTVFGGQLSDSQQALWRSALEWLNQQRNPHRTDIMAVQSTSWHRAWRERGLALAARPWLGEANFTALQAPCTWCSFSSTLR